MPATRIRRSHVAARNNVTAIQLNPAIFGSLTAAQLQELCRQNGLPATGRRPALQKRLQDAGIAQNVEPQQQNPSEVTDGQSSSNNGDQRPVIPDQFTAEQMSQIKRLIQDSVATATREIASEAARAAVSAMQAQAPALPTPAANLPDIFPPQQQPPVAEQTQQTANPASCHNGAPFQDIPGNYVKEIQSGEFFELNKLLPKNLSLHDEGDNLVLSLENSVVKVSKKAKQGTSITDVEQWTTAFTIYLSVLTHKFPLRSQELLQYLSLIRYAARVHKGLGWAIYDYKFRQKASTNKSLVWSVIDSQLWLTIFTAPPAVLKEEYPLFNQGPFHSSVSTGGSYRGICINYNRYGSCTRDPCRFRHVCNRCSGTHPGCDCPPSSQHLRDRNGVRDKDQGSSKSSSSRKHK